MNKKESAAYEMINEVVMELNEATTNYMKNKLKNQINSMIKIYNAMCEECDIIMLSENHDKFELTSVYVDECEEYNIDIEVVKFIAKENMLGVGRVAKLMIDYRIIYLFVKTYIQMKMNESVDISRYNKCIENTFNLMRSNLNMKTGFRGVIVNGILKIYKNDMLIFDFSYLDYISRVNA